MSAADPQDLAARPAFAQFLAALRGGEGPCPRCEGRGRLGSEDPDWPGPHPELGPLPVECPRCGGSGRVAVPPDPEAGPALADWWLEGGVPGGSDGGDLAGMLVAYWRPPVEPPRSAEFVCLSDISERDDSLRPALVALTERDDDPRVRALAAAARGLWLRRYTGTHPWCVTRGSGEQCLCPNPMPRTEPAACLALKRAVLALYDPLVRVPCRAEGTRLTVRHAGAGVELELAWRVYEDGARQTPADLRDEYRLDGVRLGAPPDWSWTSRRVECGRCRGSGDTRGPGKRVVRDCPGCGGTGSRLLASWDCRPSDLLPAAAPDATRPRCTECGGLGYGVRTPGNLRLACRACDGTGFEDEAARQREAERAWRGEEPLY